jgi:hypothetical protein
MKCTEQITRLDLCAAELCPILFKFLFVGVCGIDPVAIHSSVSIHSSHWPAQAINQSNQSGSSRFQSWSHLKSQANGIAQPPLTCAALAFIGSDTGYSSGPAGIPGARRSSTGFGGQNENEAHLPECLLAKAAALASSPSPPTFFFLAPSSSTGTRTFLAPKRLVHAMTQRTRSQNGR